MDRLLAAVRPHAKLQPVAFETLPGWRADDCREALQVMAASCRAILEARPPLRTSQPVPALLAGTCKLVLVANDVKTAESARGFFERNFRPHRIVPLNAPVEKAEGFLTGYYEPVISGSLKRTTEFSEPLLSKPAGHVVLEGDSAALGLPAGLTTAYRDSQGTLAAYPDRAAIDNGALANQSYPIAWVRDGIEAFMIHVQGSARIRLQNGQSLRIKYAGRNGYPYTSIGRVLVQKKLVPLEELTLARLKRWVRVAGQDRGAPGRALLHENKSFIFFEADASIKETEGPVGAAGVNLHALRSIAIDRNIWPYGLPFWIDAHLPWRSSEPAAFRRLMIAQDTGSAILGPARADLYFGSGDAAGTLAGGIRHSGAFFVLLPA